MKPSRSSVIALIIANTVPLFGVLFFNWTIFQIFFLYWCESGVIGFYNSIKVIKMCGFESILVVPFINVPLGLFMAVHFWLILGFMAPELAPTSFSFFPSLETLLPLLSPIVIPIGTLFVSHGFSFFSNFIGNREYEHMDIARLISESYKRIGIMQISIILGGMLIDLFDVPILGAAILVVAKLITDLHAHINEHSSKETESPE